MTPGRSLVINFLKTYLSAFVINLGSQKLDLKTNEQGLFMCPKENCPYTSVHITHVKDHFKTHSGEQPFQCKICLMKFKYKQSCKGWFSLFEDSDIWCLTAKICIMETIKAHIRAHNDRFKIKCTYCNQRFVNNRNMKKHIQSSHPVDDEKARLQNLKPV